MSCFSLDKKITKEWFLMYMEVLSNEQLGAKIRENHQKHLERIAEMTPVWEKEGLELRERRTRLNISQKQIGQSIGVNTRVISKLENGKYIDRRKLVITSYCTSIKCIAMEHFIAAMNGGII